MKTWKKVLLGILLVLLLTIGAFAVWQRNNIKSVVSAATHTSEELAQQIADNDNQIQEAINAQTDVTVRDMTDEEKDALRSGELTVDELVERMTDGSAAGSGETALSGTAESSNRDNAVGQSTVGSVSEASPSNDGLSDQSGSDTQTVEEQGNYQKELSAIVAKVLILRERFENELKDLENDARKDYDALSSENRSEKLASLASRYIARAGELENECDTEMNALITEMRTLIYQNNGNPSFPDTVLQTYWKEKELKKAWYMNKLKDYGL